MPIIWRNCRFVYKSNKKYSCVHHKAHFLLRIRNGPRKKKWWTHFSQPFGKWNECLIWLHYCLSKRHQVQLPTHQWIQSTPYVCNERILDVLLFTSNKIFLKETLLKLVALRFTLILVPFELKLVNYSTRCQSLKTPRK